MQGRGATGRDLVGGKEVIVNWNMAQQVTEKEVTRQIRQVLKICRIWHWKEWQGPMSFPKGISDILGIYKGRMLAIEVKRPGGRVSQEQRAFLERVNEEGGVGFVAYSVDDVVERLELGVKLNPLFAGGPK
jgi:hypothetical protein